MPNKDNGAKQFGITWPTTLFIVLLPITVIATQQLLLETYAPLGASKSYEITDISLGIDLHVIFESARRINLFVISILYFSVCAFAILKITRDFFTLLSKKGKTIIGTGWFLLIVVGLTVAYFSVKDNNSGLNINIIGAKWFFLALDGLNEHSSKTYNNFSINWGYKKFINLIDASAIVTAFTIPFLIAGTVSCLDKHEGMSEIENWKFQTNRFKIYLFYCSAVLILGTLFFKTWISYPSLLLVEENQKVLRAGMDALSISMSTFTGVTYTLLFAAFALPTGFILNSRANILAIENMDDLNPRNETGNHLVFIEKKRKALGLTLTSLELVQTFIALIAPMLTGAFSGLLNTLT